MQLDHFDLSILRYLQVNCRHPADAIGVEIGLSATAVQRRIRRLREVGVIQAEVAVIAPDAVGYPLVLLVELVFAKGLADTIDQFKRQMLALPEVQQCYYVAGEYDFMLVLHAASMADYEAFTRAVFFKNSNIIKFRTTVVMDAVKRGLTLPI
ncbi:Lrp/AsnC family transcriptional regulator [Undibacterium parvum]|uniref:Lrp/AsnC family transcriptional regulator n=2 Tax=Undibacterium TaxID=401469 RepID=A0A6M4A3P4_9BURK|nr:Lrp/AsnC family transcriptional regulator [Undibacterium parvum]AZP11471.1 Lrp/AsnC family transcriptional regulator [Undibacterium parvum]QJQ05936.1 Lrp/AsnC family transcriptional regulator [Undibacterium piscinae]